MTLAGLFLNIYTMKCMLEVLRMKHQMLLLVQANKVIRIVIPFVKVYMVDMGILGTRVDTLSRIEAVSNKMCKNPPMLCAAPYKLVSLDSDTLAQ